MIDILDIETGNSYACKYKGLNEDRIGIIKQRDIENKLVILIDEQTRDELVVSFDDIWDIDNVEWVEKES